MAVAVAAAAAAVPLKKQWRPNFVRFGPLASVESVLVGYEQLAAAAAPEL